MKKMILIIILIVFIIIAILNYPNITISAISKLQYKGNSGVVYEDGVEPRERIADIAIAALGSITKSKESMKAYRYIAINAKKMPGISNEEVQYLLHSFKQYNDKSLYISLRDLQRLGLCTPIKKDLRGGILLSIDEVVEITNDRAVLKVSYHESGLGAAGYICNLVYKDNKWQVESLDLKYIA